MAAAAWAAFTPCFSILLRLTSFDDGLTFAQCVRARQWRQAWSQPARYSAAGTLKPGGSCKRRWCKRALKQGRGGGRTRRTRLLLVSDFRATCSSSASLITKLSSSTVYFVRWSAQKFRGVHRQRWVSQFGATKALAWMLSGSKLTKLTDQESSPVSNPVHFHQQGSNALVLLDRTRSPSHIHTSICALEHSEPLTPPNPRLPNISRGHPWCMHTSTEGANVLGLSRTLGPGRRRPPVRSKRSGILISGAYYLRPKVDAKGGRNHKVARTSGDLWERQPKAVDSTVAGAGAGGQDPPNALSRGLHLRSAPVSSSFSVPLSPVAQSDRHAMTRLRPPATLGLCCQPWRDRSFRRASRAAGTWRLDNQRGGAATLTATVPRRSEPNQCAGPCFDRVRNGDRWGTAPSQPHSSAPWRNPWCGGRVSRRDAVPPAPSVTSRAHRLGRHQPAGHLCPPGT